MRIAATVLALGGLAGCFMSPASAADSTRAGDAAVPAASVPTTAAPVADESADAPLPAPSGDVEHPKVVVLMAAVGDRLTMVRQKPSVGSNLDPFIRRPLRIPGRTMNMAVLRGLDLGIAQEYPEAARVFLSWQPTPELAERLDDIKGHNRDQLLLEAVLDHLRPLEERARWDRIELIVPKYRSWEAGGMATKLQGMGIYVQPLARGMDLLDASMVPADSEAGGRRVVNPTTGEVIRANTFVAPFLFFERIALDARTLTVVKRQEQYDAAKYNDPMAVARDVGESLSPAQMAEKLSDLAERSAFQAIRGKGGSVDVTAPRIAAPAAPVRSASETAR
ncbi:hypothetical protein CDL60_27135 [Roseateles noduli]|nr:hypothetical protein CDL60_27135 [Roseateles noduli]